MRSRVERGKTDFSLSPQVWVVLVIRTSPPTNTGLLPVYIGTPAVVGGRLELQENFGHPPMVPAFHICSQVVPKKIKVPDIPLEAGRQLFDKLTI